MKNFRIPPYENARMVPDEPDILEFLMQWNDDILHFEMNNWGVTTEIMFWSPNYWVLKTILGPYIIFIHH